MKPIKVYGRGLSLEEATGKIDYILNGRWDNGKKYRIVSANLVGENVIYKGERIDVWKFGIVPINHRRWRGGIY